VSLLEIKRRERLSRDAAAARLRALADDLARHNELEFTSDATRLRVDVADEIELKVELEIDRDGTELEIELKW
jgi:amphi-Trp domain-containing protein